MNKINLLTIENLQVVNFRSEYANQEVLGWRTDKPIATAESCNRQVWYGRKNDFDTFPRHLIRDDRVTIMQGEQAYSFLVNLVAGLNSEDVGETNISGQFTEGWHAFQKREPLEERRFQKLIQALTEDSRTVRSHICTYIKPARKELIARTLAGQAMGNTILLMAAAGNDQGLSLQTRDMLKTALSKNKKPSEVVIMHPQRKTTVTLWDKAKAMQRAGEIPPTSKSPICTSPICRSRSNSAIDSIAFSLWGSIRKQINP